MLDDPQIQYFMSRILAHGVIIKYDPHELMTGLAKHLNNCQYGWYVVGDEDGLIVHDKLDQPLLFCIYDGEILSFRSPLISQGDLDPEYANHIAKALLNIVGHITSITGTIKPVGVTPDVGEEITTVVQDDDWSI